MGRARRFLALLACAAVAAGCGAGGPPGPSPAPPRSAVPRSHRSHVVVLVMENHEYGEIIGSRAAPYTTALARRYALATRYYAIRHPSLPNYLALTGGSTFGIDSDCTDCHVAGGGLAGQFARRRVDWRAYMEGLPRPCFKGAESGQYAKKHDPFAYYDGIVRSRRQCARIVPDRRLAADLRNDRLPAFAWITPGLCNDTHDCSIATGDRYLSRLVPALLRGLGPHGALFITWDEGSSDAGCCRGAAHGGQVATIVAGPDVRRGARLTQPYDHYSLLLTVERAFGLGPLRGAAAAATHPLDAAFTRPPRL